MNTLIRKEGYLIGSGISPDTIQTTITNHYDVDLCGNAANGNQVSITISVKGYPKEDGSIVKVPPGMTAVDVEFSYYGYENQIQNSPPSTNMDVRCVGSGCPVVTPK